MSPVEKFKSLSISDLPIKSIQKDACGALRFEVAEIFNPSDFYVCAKTDDHESYVELDERLNEYYSSRESRLHSYAQLIQYDFVFEKALCVCKSRQNGRFYRAQVKYYSQSEKSAGESDDRAALHIFVTYIDYGVLDHTLIGNLFPISAEYTSLSPYCIPCSLNLVQPVNDVAEGTWSDEAVGFFREKIIHEARGVIRAVVLDSEEKLDFVYANISKKSLSLIILNESDQVCEIFCASI